MGLIKCPDCLKEVSEQARSCPSCGYPLKQAMVSEATGKNWKGIQLVSLAAIFFGILVTFATTLAQKGTYGGFLILGGIIGLLAGTKVFIYLVAVYWGVVLGFIIYLIP